MNDEHHHRPRIRTTLPRLRAGHCGIVRELLSDEHDVNRLQAMGICRGRKVMLVRRGDPLILRVLGSRIGVSARLADMVEVETCGSDSPDEEAS